MRTSLRIIFCLTTLLVLAFANANESRTKQDLDAVQKELEKSQKSYQQQNERFNKLKRKLRDFELQIAQHAKALSLTEQGINENRQQQYTLENENKSLNQQKIRLQKLLAGQLKSAYMTGSHDYSKMLLNQEHSATLERTLSYYDYFNKARIAQIETLKEVIKQLAENQKSLEQKQQQLNDLFKQQTERLAALKASKEQRQNSLSQLNSALKQTQSAIAYLKENEQTLITTLSQLHEQQSESLVPVELIGLRSKKGKLPWPSKGRLKHRFGQRKHAGMNWKGVVIAAKTGDNVKAVQQGQVVFADWLNGFGWVIVIDHGLGYMSLYGHAQTLLKDVGDQVRSGESIALVGQSGGQANPGLYFELRHKGSAVDPVKWCK
ncbi:murein hydrolase activator EnvC family protein [Pseudoalteromonas phenolica]|uniref:murein hydrolase activator EnvC family protein n=1 Tax=Pseudoalteromonas phenolica TaxID=161398 RepID=UPI00110B9DAB|nr:peptidoglycan DD-metalloendopeptidase family protein [Pseudoalteromonas phenolica]TMO55087.1 protease [Pseudoalteromonas phenolica]